MNCLQEKRPFSLLPLVDRFDHFSYCLPAPANEFRWSREYPLSTACNWIYMHVLVIQFPALNGSKHYAITAVAGCTLKAAQQIFLKLMRKRGDLQAIVVPFQRMPAENTKKLIDHLESLGIESAVTSHLSTQVSIVVFKPKENQILARDHAGNNERVMATHGF